MWTRPSSPWVVPPLGLSSADALPMVKIITGFLNLVLLAEKPPPDLCRRRVTLVPKSDVATEPSQLRPISVTSLVLSCLHKIVARRWGGICEFESQFAFQAYDGGLEATLARHSIRSVHSEIMTQTW